jgi:KaiC/GvpD/RAD55 family RecA-like ATPase
MGFEDFGDAKKQELAPKKAAETQPSNSSNRGFVTLLYGDTGTGKTYVSLTFPAPIFVIDTENRAMNTKLGRFKGKEITIYEPTELKQSINKTMDDIFDEVKSINNLSEALSDYVHKVEMGEIKGGTLIIDSTSDVWSWIQAWMYDRLSGMYNKKGEARANSEMQTVADQRDWKLANNKHDGIVKVLRSLIKHGIYVVYTAREKAAPEYVAQKPSNKEKIKCQKELPYACDVILELKKEGGEYIAICDKLGVQAANGVTIKQPSFEKIIALKPLGE